MDYLTAFFKAAFAASGVAALTLILILVSPIFFSGFIDFFTGMVFPYGQVREVTIPVVTVMAVMVVEQVLLIPPEGFVPIGVWM